jgi:RNA polymerase sigma factor (sigma-70 family)
MHRSDSDLIKACQRGEQAAWDALVEQYGRLVYSIPTRYGLVEADADDVFAAVWATAFKSLDALRDDTKLSAWLITTTHRECWRVGKKRGTYQHLNDVMPDVSSPSESQSEKWETQHLVRRALRQLGGRCEELLTALFLEPAEASYETIAARLDMPVGSIGPTRARCFKKLQAILMESGVSLG